MDLMFGKIPNYQLSFSELKQCYSFNECNLCNKDMHYNFYYKTPPPGGGYESMVVSPFLPASGVLSSKSGDKPFYKTNPLQITKPPPSQKNSAKIFKILELLKYLNYLLLKS